MKNINWKRLLLTVGGFALTVAGYFVDDAKQKDDINQAVMEQIAEITAKVEE